jgi:hypothetical protein
VTGLLIALAVSAAWANWGGDWQVVAVVNALAAFWSNGVLANFPGDPHGAPDWAAAVSMLSALAAIVLLLVAWLA